MREVGIDLSSRTPQKLTDELCTWADVVVTMGCQAQCPSISGKRHLDWALADPKDMPLPELRPLRDDIRRLVQELIRQL